MFRFFFVTFHPRNTINGNGRGLEITTRLRKVRLPVPPHIQGLVLQCFSTTYRELNLPTDIENYFADKVPFSIHGHNVFTDRGVL